MIKFCLCYNICFVIILNLFYAIRFFQNFSFLSIDHLLKSAVKRYERQKWALDFVLMKGHGQGLI